MTDYVKLVQTGLVTHRRKINKAKEKNRAKENDYEIRN